jgi:hypothetical protein
MSNLNRFLKVLQKVGYPNPDILSIAKMVDYNLDEFLPDMVAEIGEEKTNEFAKNAIGKISTKDGIKLQDLDDPEQYAHIHVLDPYVDLEEDKTLVMSDWSWGDSNIFYKDNDGNEGYKTIQEIYNEIGMGEWADFDEMVDDIKNDCSDLVYKNCGFGVWFQDRI